MPSRKALPETEALAIGYHSLTARPVTADDSELDFLIYASTREPELALLPWPAQQKDQFLRMQHQTQSSQYRQHYPDARFLMIEWQQQVIGRLIVNYTGDAIQLIDIALLPDFQRRGHGTALLQSLLKQAEQLQLPVVLQVIDMSPAIALYHRLGFRFTGDEPNSLYKAMVWRPNHSKEIGVVLMKL